MQQHSYPSHSMHFVFPALLSPLTMLLMVEEAAEPGPLRLTKEEGVEVHIFGFGGRSRGEVDTDVVNRYGRGESLVVEEGAGAISRRKIARRRGAYLTKTVGREHKTVFTGICRIVRVKSIGMVGR